MNLSSERDGPRIYILLNKPKNVYTTNVAQGEQVPAGRSASAKPARPGLSRRPPRSRFKRLFLFTNDGEMTHRLTHPHFGIAKTYRAIVDGYITPQSMQALSKGVWLSDGGAAAVGSKTGRSFVKIVKRFRDLTILEITIREGRNGHIRRSCSRE